MSRTHWVTRLALAGYWIALAVATHLPRVPMPQQISNTDKIIHFTAFGILALLFWIAVRPRSMWVAVAVLIPYAAADEYLQQFVGRFTELGDFIANAAGILTVLAIVALRRQRSAASASTSAGSAS